MMGAVRGMEFPIESCRIAPDSRLVIFSDGVFEILRDGHIVWTLSACTGHLATLHAGKSADERLMDDLLAHVRHLRGSTQLDDDFSIIEARFR
jgi:serine phosphatase RsbU (regulator of sigma subunit)